MTANYLATARDGRHLKEMTLRNGIERAPDHGVACPRPHSLLNIAEGTGLPIELDERTGELHLHGDATSCAPAARQLEELRAVLRDPEAKGPGLAYHAYRGVHLAGDERLLAKARVRYDLTITLPGKLGCEYVKTVGHYHRKEAQGVSFPEIYEVVHGRAAFLLQRVADPTCASSCVEDVWIQVCGTGERILIPPDCGHVTVNIGLAPLVVANLISVRCAHLYQSFTALRGAAYYVLRDRSARDGLRLERNPAYESTPTPVVAWGSRCEPFLPLEPPLYSQFKARSELFSFLDDAAAFAELSGLWPQRSHTTGDAKASR